VLLLSNGRLLFGAIGAEGSDYVLRNKAGTIRFPKSQVEQVFGSLEEVYRYKRARIPDRDPDDRLKLARWCLSQNLRAEAKTELEAVVALSPKSGEAKAMLASIAAAEARASQPRVDPEVQRSGGGPGGSGMDRGQVQRPEELDPSLFSHASKALGFSVLPVIFDLPPAAAVQRAEQFARFVHPVLQNACVRCHNERQDGKFQLVEVKPGRRASPDVLRANLDATLALIDPDNLPRSVILSTVVLPHGNGPNARPVFRGTNDPRFQILSSWVNSLRNTAKPSTDGVVQTRFGPTPAGKPQESGGGFASERGTGAVPLPLTPTPSAASAGQVVPSNVRQELIAPPSTRFVPGQGMVIEKNAPSGDEFPVSPLLGGPAPRSNGLAGPPNQVGTTQQPGLPPPGTRPQGPLPPGALPELPPGAAVPGATDGQDGAATAKSDKPRKPVKIDPDLLQKALLNRNFSR
jgi:hypothetical protein